MNKTDFLANLQILLKKYSVTNGSQYLNYYSEYLDDLIENGDTESQAIQEIGGPRKVILQILADDNVKLPKTKNTIKNVMLIVGLPVWGPLIAALYVIGMAIAFSVFICAFAFGISGIWMLFGCVVELFKAGALYAILQVGVSASFIGLGLLLFELFVFLFRKVLLSAKYIFKQFSIKED